MDSGTRMKNAPKEPRFGVVENPGLWLVDEGTFSDWLIRQPWWMRWWWWLARAQFWLLNRLRKRNARAGARVSATYTLALSRAAWQHEWAEKEKVGESEPHQKTPNYNGVQWKLRVSCSAGQSTLTISLCSDSEFESASTKSAIFTPRLNWNISKLYFSMLIHLAKLSQLSSISLKNSGCADTFSGPFSN